LTIPVLGRSRQIFSNIHEKCRSEKFKLSPRSNDRKTGTIRRPRWILPSPTTGTLLWVRGLPNRLWQSAETEPKERSEVMVGLIVLLVNTLSLVLRLFGRIQVVVIIIREDQSKQQ
jgi:hypothetical protein